MVSIFVSSIDEDDFSLKLSQSDSGFFYHFGLLLQNPTKSNLEKTVSLFNISEIVQGVKRLLKFKYVYMTEEYQKNLLIIVKRLLKLDSTLDTLFINMLRLRLDEECLKLYKKGLVSEEGELFLYFHMWSRGYSSSTGGVGGHTSSTGHLFKYKKGLEVLGRDALLSISRDALAMEAIFSKHAVIQTGGHAVTHQSHNHAVSQTGGHAVHLFKDPTPMKFLVSLIPVELEYNILFLLEADIKGGLVTKRGLVEENFDFYMENIFKFYITNLEDASRIIRYIKNITNSKTGERIISRILEVYEDAHFSVVYDEPITTSTGGISRLMDDIIRILFGLNFPKYFRIVKDMKILRKAFIPKEYYKGIISQSYKWDNYVQVYLWKILFYQRVYLGMDLGMAVKEEATMSMEGEEGMMSIRAFEEAASPPF